MSHVRIFLAGFLLTFALLSLCSTRYRLEAGMVLRDKWAGRIYHVQDGAWVSLP